MRPATAAALQAAGMEPSAVAMIIENALLEDLGHPGRQPAERSGAGGQAARWNHSGDVTSIATIPADREGEADLVARAAGVVAGLWVAAAVFQAVQSDDEVPGAAVARHIEFEAHVTDGAAVARGAVLATVAGPTRALLTAERTALNLLCRMSGVATHTRAWADALAGTKARVLDTRKTTPGLRILEKYAVRAGGGTNKRMGLYDVAMIKDNHKIAAGGLANAFRLVRAAFPEVPVQVEATTLAEAVEAVEAGATFLLLDNMAPDLLADVVAAVGDRAELEATGGLTLDKVRAFAETGVDYLSVGALTHSSPILDIALDLRPR